MDLVHFRKKNNILRPVTRKGFIETSPYTSNHNNNSRTGKLQNYHAYQIALIPSGSAYCDYFSVPDSKSKTEGTKRNTQFLPIIESPTNMKSMSRNQEREEYGLKKKKKEAEETFEEFMVDSAKRLKTNQFENIIEQINEAKPTSVQEKKYLYEKLEKIFGYYESQVIAKGLNKMLTKQLLLDQAKIYICSQSLLSGLSVVKLYSKATDASQNPFEIINNMNKGILQYLISKYPRSRNLFVELELESKFDNINFITRHENNVLVNCNYTFTQKNLTRVEKLDRTKFFLNKVLTELDEKFAQFSNLLNNKIFKLKDGKIDEKLNKIKIGRKIPENNEKYYEFKTEQMQIHSPQLFRVMIKWIQAMEDLLTSPSQMINKRSSIKYIKRNLGIGNVIFDEIQSKRFEEMKIEIIQKITSEVQWKADINKLLDKLNEFNNNLINTLTVRSPKNKFINEDQAETLKFSKFNTLFLEWLIVEKFLILIDALCNLSAYFQTKYYKKLDFINFNVYDLLRGSFSGKKYQILEVFKNMHQLEEDGEITIVRVKNRLNTPLNDVLINFTIKQSFIICQIQLVLVQNLLEGEEKLKMMEFLNHIIYELERSPYGSLSEMALIVGYYDPTIIYEKKITFEKDWFKEQICQKGNKHQFIQINDQTTPFVCSWCVNFYGRQQNFFQYNQCIHCSLQKCKACVFQEDSIEEKRTYYKYFASCFLKLSLEEIENDKDDDFIDNFFIRDQTSFISENYLKLRKELHIEAKETKLEAIQGIMHSKQKQYGLKATQPFYCLLLRFQSGNHHLKVLKYVNFKIEICTEEKGIEKKFRVEKHDALFFFRRRVYRNPKDDKYTYIDSISSSEVKQLKDITDGSKVKIRKKGYNVIYIRHNRENYMLDWERLSTKMADEDNEKINRVLETVISKCEAYKAERNCIQLQNLGLGFKHLSPLTQKKWCKTVKVLNVTNNRIESVSEIFKNFEKLQELYISKNLIENFQLGDIKKPTLRVLDISKNYLNCLSKQINELQQLVILKANNNKISTMATLNLDNLEELHINSNELTDLSNLKDSALPELEIINISNNKLSKEQFHMNILDKFKNLRKIQARRIQFKIQENTKLELNSFKKMQYLQLSNNRLFRLQKIYQKHLREIRMSACGIESLQGVFSDKLIDLEILKLDCNRITVFPEIDLPELTQLDFSANQIENISNISKSYLPKLEILQLNANKITDITQFGKAELPHLLKLILNLNEIVTIPPLDFPSLKLFNLINNKLEDISNLSVSHLPNLKRLLIRHNNIKKLPIMKFQNLEDFIPCENQISDLHQFRDSYLPKLSKISLWENKIQEIPKLNISTAEQLLLFNNRIKDMSGLTQSKLPFIKIISLYGNLIHSLSVITLDTLEKFFAYKNKISDISSLRHWKTPKLQVLDLNSNKIKDVPKFDIPSLNELELSQNIIENVDHFSQSELFSLRKLYINKNKIKYLPPLMNFPKLQEIQINDCTLDNFEDFTKHQLKHLKKIFIENNILTHLPKLSNFKNLQQLYVRGNKIQSIDQKFSENKKLKRFWASGNQLAAICSQDYEDSSLEELSLSKNPLVKIEGLQNVRLKSLTLNSCKIKSLEGFYAPRLSELRLKDNLIEDLSFLNEPGAFISLTKLIIQKNRIKSIPPLDLPSAIQISLKNNPIQKIDELLLSALPSIRRIFMNNSKLQSVSPNLKKTESEVKQQKLFEENEDEDDGEKREEDEQNLVDTQKIVFNIEEFIVKFVEMFPKCVIKI